MSGYNKESINQGRTGGRGLTNWKKGLVKLLGSGPGKGKKTSADQRKQ